MNEDNNLNNQKIPTNNTNGYQPSIIRPGETPAPPVEQVAQIALPPKKSKKKLIILVILLIIAIVGGIGAYFYLKDSKKESSQVIVPPQDFKPVSIKNFVYTDTEVKYLNETGELADFATISTNERPVEAINNDGNTELRYVVTEEGVNGSLAVKSYGSITTGGKKELVQLPEGIDYYWSNFSVSPDGRLLLLEKTNSEGFMDGLITVNIENGEVKDAFKPVDPHKDGLLSFIAWKNDSSVILQRQTCRQCDGPRLPELALVDITNGQAQPFYVGDKTKMEYGDFMVSDDKKSVYLYGGSFSRVLGGTGSGDDYVYNIDLSTGRETLLKQITDLASESSNELVGVSGEGVYIANITMVETDDPDASWVSETGRRNPLSVIKFISKDGDMKDIPIESNYLKEKTYVNQITDGKEGILILVSKSNSDSGAGTTYNLLSLKLLEQTSPIDSLLEKTTDTNYRAGLITSR